MVFRNSFNTTFINQSYRWPLFSGTWEELLISIFIKEIFVLASHITDILLKIINISKVEWGDTHNCVISKSTVTTIFLDIHCFILYEEASKLYPFIFLIILILWNIITVIIVIFDWIKYQNGEKIPTTPATWSFFQYTSLVSFIPFII
jgi:hypothetical protein